MKTRSKLLLAAVSLLTVSVAATATSAYAWYTANRQVAATANSLGVHSTTGTLKIEHDKDIKQTSTDSTQVIKSGEDLVYTTNSVLTDVSSEGNGKFIKPKWDATGSTAAANCVGVYGQSNDDVPNKTVTLYGNETDRNKTTAYGVVSLGIKFTNDGETGADDMVLYLDPTVNVKATSSTNKMTSDSVVKSARFSICSVKNDGTVDSVYLYGNPKSIEGESNEVNQYVSAAAAKSVTLSDIDTTKVVDQGNFIGKSKVTDPTAGNKKLDKGYLCTIPAGESVKYLITMWVEGTDDDCKFGTSGDDSFMVEGLSISLGFYALTAAPGSNQNQGESGAGTGA